MMRIVIPFVDYHPHATERSWYRPIRRRVGFAPWVDDPTIDDASRDSETFAQQETRLRRMFRVRKDTAGRRDVEDM